MPRLEGGPPLTPIGCGHPCAFTEVGTRSRTGRGNDGSVLSWEGARGLVSTLGSDLDDLPSP
jgi:hypothetical protein